MLPYAPRMQNPVDVKVMLNTTSLKFPIGELLILFIIYAPVDCE